MLVFLGFITPVHHFYNSLPKNLHTAGSPGKYDIVTQHSKHDMLSTIEHRKFFIIDLPLSLSLVVLGEFIVGEIVV